MDRRMVFWLSDWRYCACAMDVIGLVWFGLIYGGGVVDGSGGRRWIAKFLIYVYDVWGVGDWLAAQCG